MNFNRLGLKNSNFIIKSVILVLLVMLSIKLFRSQLGNMKQIYQPIILDSIAMCEPNSHSVCFLGRRFCHPGYNGPLCEKKMTPANPWYTKDCPNLLQDITYDVNMPFEMLSKENCTKNGGTVWSGIPECANLCFSHPVSGIPQIPLEFWKRVQAHENKVWKGGSKGNDRGMEHLDGFHNYDMLPHDLGDFIEVGCGPYSQTQFIIKRNFKSITLLDPGIDYYLKNVPGCSYKDGKLREKDVRLLNYGAERLIEDKEFGKFDTLLSINVIDHVWDAYKHLSNLHDALKPGGILIFHDRFSPYPRYLDCALGPGNWYHPIRVSRTVYEHFFNHFETIYMFEGLTKEQIKRKCGEVGFYFIGRKKTE